MVAYITITEPETDPGAPGTSELWKKWRDNPIAIAEGAAGAPKVLGQALDIFLANVNTSTNVPGGWTNLDRTTWVEVDIFVEMGGTAAPLQARLSSDNGSTWSAYGSVITGNFVASTLTALRSFVNIKTGAFRTFGGPGTFTSGTLALTGAPNALQFRINAANTVSLIMNAKSIGGQP